MNSRVVAAACGVLFAFLAAACVPDPANPLPGATPEATQAFWVGATIQGIELAPTAENGGRSAGTRLDFLLPGGAADKAGLREGDVVLTYDGKPAGTPADLVKAVNAGGAKAVPVTLLRDGRPLTLTVTAQPRPAASNTIFRDAKQKRLEAERTAAADAKAAGDFKAAFDHYVVALRLQFGSNDGVSYNADVAQIASLLPRLPSPPGSLTQADNHNRRALAILKSATTDEDNDRVVNEFGAAIYEAPWLADLYLNSGLVQAKAGFPEAAAVNLRRYLLLKPAATDTVAVKQKIAELEVLSDERKPWYPFLATTWVAQDGSVKTIRLRGRQLKIVVTKGSGQVKSGDVLCSGTIHGSKFQGKCAVYSDNPEAVTCLGSKFDVDANGAINAVNTLTIRYRGDVNFNTQTCALNYERWKDYLTFSAGKSA